MMSMSMEVEMEMKVTRADYQPVLYPIMSLVMGMVWKGWGLRLISLILDDEFVDGGGDGAENDGGQPASVVPDDELGDRDGLKGAGLAVNQCCSERWDWQWRRTSRGTGLTILSALFWIMDLIMGIVGRGRDNRQSRFSGRWDWQWRRSSRRLGLTILSALCWMMDLIMGICGSSRANCHSAVHGDELVNEGGAECGQGCQSALSWVMTWSWGLCGRGGANCQSVLSWKMNLSMKAELKVAEADCQSELPWITHLVKVVVWKGRG